MMLKTRFFAGFAALIAAGSLLATNSVTGAESKASPKESDLISVLKSSAPPADKAVTCKKLAIYGTAEAVPVLAPLLADPDLASWARIALEAIPGPAADKALREGLEKLHGRLLIGCINSIGVRGDEKAVSALATKLKDADAGVVSAAAVALGRIGGTKAASALKKALADGPTEARAGIAEGCVRCAEKFLNEKSFSKAAKLYDSVREANVPKQKVLEATRGAILARRTAGVPMLVEQLRSSDKALFGMGLRTARELPGPEATKAVAAELAKASADRQPLLLLALADRGDAAALPTIVEAAKTGSKKVRIAAVGVLERLGNVSSVPVLLEAATSGEAELAQSASGALVRLPGAAVDTDLLNRLPQSSGKTRQVLINVAALRRIDGALPVIMQSAEDADASVRSAAVQAIGVLGEEKQAGDLVRILRKTPNAQERADIEAALLAIGGRAGTGCAQHVLSLTKDNDSALRIVGLHALAAVGGSEALGAIRSAVEDKDEGVQDEAVRTLSSWPNTWPEDATVAQPLVELAKSGKKMSHQVLAMRGYLQFLQGDKKLKGEERVAMVKEVLPLLKRPEEKRLAIAAIHDVSSAGTLEVLTGFAAEEGVAEDACSAIVKIAGKNVPGASKEDRQKALQTAVEKSTNDGTRKKAEEALNKIK